MSIYDQEAEALANIPQGGSGGDWKFFDPPKPASIGAQTSVLLRVIQRLPLGADGAPDINNPYPAFWVRTAQHRVTLDGADKTLTCPDDPTVKGAPVTCPICKLRSELYKEKRKEWEALATDLKARPRCFANIIDMSDPAKHWESDGGQGFIVRPFVWGYSLTVHKLLIEMCRTKRPIEDWQVGRTIKLVVEKTGKLKMNVKYQVLEASDSEPLREDLFPILYASLDLEALAKPADMSELANVASVLDPRAGGRRSTGGPPGGQRPGAPPAQDPYQGQQYQPPAQHGDRSYDRYGQPPTHHGAPPPPQRPEAESYHYASPIHGQQEGFFAETVAQWVAADENYQPGAHQVWAPSLGNWTPVEQVPEIATALARLRPAPPPQQALHRPGGPPPMPSAAPPPATQHADPSQPRGGYPVGGPPQPPARSPGPPAAPQGAPPPQQARPPAQPGPPGQGSRGGGPPPPPPPPPGGDVPF